MEQPGTEAVEQPRAEAAAEQPRAEAAAEQPQGRRLKVMVAMDESEGSLYALSWALDNLFPLPAPADDAGEVVIVHVQQPFQNYVFPAGPGIMYLPATDHPLLLRLLLLRFARVFSRSELTRPDPLQQLCTPRRRLWTR